jgi:ketol-acid reductoisomerase
VVVGGVTELVEAAFQTLVDAGYDDRLAYLEVVHQLKHLVDVIHDRARMDCASGSPRPLSTAP